LRKNIKSKLAGVFDVTREDGIQFLLKNDYEGCLDLAEKTVDDFINHSGLLALKENLLKFVSVKQLNLNADILREYRINEDGHLVDD